MSPDDYETIEHGEPRAARSLRHHKLRIALAVAILEGLLVLVDVIPWWLVVVLAAASVVTYLAAGRESSHDVFRHSTWIAAVSQLAVILVPVVAVIVGVLAVVVIVLLAVGLLALLIADRR